MGFRISQRLSTPLTITPYVASFANPFISNIEGHAFFRCRNLHEKGFKATISAEIGNEMCKIGIIFFQGAGHVPSQSVPW